MSFDQKKYIYDFKRTNYDKIQLDIPKGKRQLIKNFAVNQNKSMSQVIIKAIETYCNIDLSK
jgi:hypothetical protein